MRNSPFYIILCLLFSTTWSVAQDAWSLEKCVTYARDNSIQVKQAQISIDNAVLTEKQNKQARYPNLTGSSTYSSNFGRSIDPTTNTFDTRNIQSNSLSLNAGVQIYDGFQTKNAIKQSELDFLAAQADKERVINDLGLSIALAYLQVLLAQDQVTIAKNRLTQNQDQLDQTDRLIQAGTLPRANRYAIEAQIATDEQGVISAENALENAYLALKNQLDLDADFALEIERPEINLPSEGDLDVFTVEALYQQALSGQPQIKANDYRKQSAEKGIDIAKGRLQPNLTAFGSVGTNYSNAAQRVTGFNTLVDSIPIIVGPDTYYIPQEVDVPILEKNPYFNQLNQNLNQAVGLRLTVPIYNNGINRIAIQRAELTVLNAEYTDELTKRQLKADIQQALANAKASAKELKAAEKTVEAQRIAYENAQKRYELGASTTFEFTSAKNDLDNALSNLAGSKYNYLFRLKVLDFYQGNEINLN